jgi:REP element-mobilizing transposase RayT
VNRGKVELVRSAHGVGESNFHIVLVPAYRRPIFADAQVRELTVKYIKEKLAELNVVLVLAEFGPDHLHMFWANVVDVGVREAIRLVKGYSSRAMRAMHRKLFVQWLWGKKFWTAGKFYRSVGAVTAERTALYIATAERRHFESMPLEEWVEAKQARVADFLSSSLPHF